MELLFVYGTLLADFKHPEGKKLRDSAVRVGIGRTLGTLYDIGEYPGLVKGEGLKVLGEIYDLSNCASLWAELDDYEGVNDSNTPEYTREQVIVTTATTTITCWTYIYQGIVQNLVRIKGGDYIGYFKEKYDHGGIQS